MLQKQYIQKDLETLVDGFIWILGEYDAETIFNGLKTYVEKNNDIPTPSDILKVINEKADQFRRNMVI